MYHGSHYHHDHSHHHDHWGHHHGCWPYFSFGIGVGFPYWSSYYAAYPDWWYPWGPYWRYPYYTGVYYGSYYPPPPSYYVEPNYVYHTSSTEPPSRSYEAAAPREEDPVTPIPRAEVVEKEKVGELEGALRQVLSGLAEFRGGRYEEASETLFAALQAAPESAGLKVYMAQSLIAIGEYRYAAEYLRMALQARPELARKSFSLSRLYADSPQGAEDLAAHSAALSEWVQLRPYDADALLCLGFVQLNTRRPAEAAATFAAFADAATAPRDQALAARLLSSEELPLGSPGEDLVAEILTSALSG